LILPAASASKGKKGQVMLIPPAENEARDAARHFKAIGIAAIAIGFLFSYLSPSHQRRAIKRSDRCC